MDLLAVQGTLKSLLQHHGSKVLILRCSAFFLVQLSHPYIPTRKTIALTRWTFVGKLMSLLFNMLSGSVITLLPRSKCLLISCLKSPSAVILEPPKIKSLIFPLFRHLFAMKRQRNQRSNCQHLLDHRKSKGVPEKTSISALLTMPKPLTVWITTNCGKFFKTWEYQTT